MTRRHLIERETVTGPRWISRAEAAQLVGVCSRTIERAINRGDLPAFRAGLRRIRLREQDLLKWVESRPVVPVAAAIEIVDRPNTE